jgi:hypothetical protein
MSKENWWENLPQRPKNQTELKEVLSNIANEIGNKIYKDTSFYEVMEPAYHQANGHHTRQHMGQIAWLMFISRLPELDRKLIMPEYASKIADSQVLRELLEICKEAQEHLNKNNK